jgi:hypothetical protein
MAKLIFGLCAATSFLCCWLLLKSYFKSGSKLLLWGGLCFVGLFLSNLLLLTERWLFPGANLMVYRLSFALAAMILLIYGLIWESE